MIEQILGDQTSRSMFKAQPYKSISNISRALKLIRMKNVNLFAKAMLLLAFFLTTISISFGQSFDSKSDSTKKMVELFNHFYDHEKLEVNVILDHGVDLKFISQIRDRNFEIITKSETSNYNTYLLFHTLDIQENVGRVRYKIVNSKVPQEFKYLRFDIKTHQLIKH